jgi:outer membrane receptor protein involved in Fe transport
VPNKPTTNQFSGNAHVSVGQTHEGGTSYAADTTLNVPLSDRSALRITAYHIDDAGWINRLVDPNASMMAQLTTGAPTSVSGDEYLHKGVNSDRTNGFQAALRFDANDWLTISPRLMYQRTDSNGPPYVDGDVNSLVKIRQFDVNEKGMDEWTLANLEIAAAVRGGDFVSSTSYFKRSTMDVEDATRFIASRLGGRIRTAVAAPSTTTAAGEEKRATQEFRFVSESKGSFQYIVGAFFQRTERSGGYPADSIFPVGSPAIGVAGIAVGDSFFSLATTFKQTEIAAFGEMNYKIVPALTLTLGARAYDIKTDQTRLDGGVLFSKLYGFTVKPYAGSEKGSGINPRLALSWEQSKELTWYANAAMGYRPGRVNDSKGACTALGKTGVRDAVDADSLWNYEGGAKGSFFGGRLQTNVAAFYIDWKNRQTSTLDCGMGFGALDNVGAVRSRGAEFDVSYALGKGFGLSAAMGYTDARVTDIGNAIGVAVGNRLANAPRTNAAVGMNFSTALSGSTIGYGRIDARYVGDSISAQKAYRPEYTIVDLRAGAKFGMWDLSVFVKNAADKRANLSDAPELSDSLNLIAIERPRTIGIDLRAKF